jgi:hypothetical protein
MMEKQQPRLDLVSGAEALEQLRQFPPPAGTGILYVPNELTWPLLVPQGGIKVQLEAGSDKQLTYGIVTGIIAFEETFHIVGRVDYAYGDFEDTVLFRLDWGPDTAMIESIGELGILGLTNEVPPERATKEELADYLSRVPTFVCEIDPQEVHRIRIQMIRMQAQRQHLGR